MLMYLLKMKNEITFYVLSVPSTTEIGGGGGGGGLGMTLVSTPLRIWRALRNIGNMYF